MPDAPPAVAIAEPDLVGQMLDGRYQVMQLLGEGMLTLVYEARHSASGRHFAIKVLRSSIAAKPHILDRFLQLARAASQIRHDNVVAIEEFGYTPTGSVYAAVELVVADTLQTILDRDGRWPWDKARPVAQQILTALVAAHNAGLVHRGLKPANCFVVLDPRGKRDPFVKVADFGLAQVGVEANQAAPGATTSTLFGDPEYMAPEQGFGGQITPQTDLYAYGVLLYRFLTGRVPFSSSNAFQTLSHHAQKPVPSLREADPQIPEAVEQLVMRCLGKTPDQRFGSAAQLEQAFAGIPAQAGHSAPKAPGAGASGPRFARFNNGAGGAVGPGGAPPPPVSKQPSVIVAGSIGDSSGGISGTLGDSSPPPYDPYAAPGGGGMPHGAPPDPYGSAAPPPFAGSTPSSFLASRPGLRMGLGAAVPNDGPAPPPTVAPGMALPSPTMAPGSMSAPFDYGLDHGPPSYSPPAAAGPGMPPSAAGAGYPPLGSGPGMPPPGLGGGYSPPGGAGPGMPPPGVGGGYSPPSGAGPGMPPGSGGGYSPPSGAGPGMPPGLGGGYSPPSGAGPGMPPPGSGGGYSPPSGAGPGMPPPGAGAGYPPPAAGAGYPPLSAGPGMPPPGAGAGYPPLSAGPGMPPPAAGPGYPGMSGAGIPPLSQGRGIPSAGVGPGMPPRDDEPGPDDGLRRGVGAGMPPRVGVPGAGVGAGMPLRTGMDRSHSGPHVVSSPVSMQDDRNAPGGLGAVEYDEEDKPRRRTLLMVFIGVAVIGLGIGLALLLASGLNGDKGEVAQVTRTQKAQDVSVDNEPEPEREPAEPEPVVEPKPQKKVVPKKTTVTFEQSLGSMKAKIRRKCAEVGAGPVDIDTFVDRSGGRANTPKVKPKNPVGTCALRIVEQWDFPASEQDHPVNERVSW